MPAYNEAENIESTIRQWYPVAERLTLECVDAKLVVANDGSRDNTFAIMQKMKTNYPMFEPLDKPNSGHGATVLYLYRYSLSNGADYIFQTDSDGQTNPEEFWQMWNNRDTYDFQIGYRKKRQDGISRVLVSKVLRLVLWLMFRKWVIDANAPFRLMKTNKLQPIINVMAQDYFLSNVAISAIAVKWGYKIGWYPITFKPRQCGVNSINLKKIFKIGIKAVGDFGRINKNLKHVSVN